MLSKRIRVLTMCAWLINSTALTGLTGLPEIHAKKKQKTKKNIGRSKLNGKKSSNKKLKKTNLKKSNSKNKKINKTKSKKKNVTKSGAGDNAAGGVAGGAIETAGARQGDGNDKSKDAKKIDTGKKEEKKGEGETRRVSEITKSEADLKDKQVSNGLTKQVAPTATISRAGTISVVKTSKTTTSAVLPKDGSAKEDDTIDLSEWFHEINESEKSSNQASAGTKTPTEKTDTKLINTTISEATTIDTKKGAELPRSVTKIDETDKNPIKATTSGGDINEDNSVKNGAEQIATRHNNDEDETTRQVDKSRLIKFSELNGGGELRDNDSMLVSISNDSKRQYSEVLKSGSGSLNWANRIGGEEESENNMQRDIDFLNRKIDEIDNSDLHDVVKIWVELWEIYNDPADKIEKDDETDKLIEKWREEKEGVKGVRLEVDLYGALSDSMKSLTSKMEKSIEDPIISATIDNFIGEAKKNITENNDGKELKSTLLNNLLKERNEEIDKDKREVVTDWDHEVILNMLRQVLEFAEIWKKDQTGNKNDEKTEKVNSIIKRIKMDMIKRALLKTIKEQKNQLGENEWNKEVRQLLNKSTEDEIENGKSKQQLEEKLESILKTVTESIEEPLEDNSKSEEAPETIKKAPGTIAVVPETIEEVIDESEYESEDNADQQSLNSQVAVTSADQTENINVTDAKGGKGQESLDKISFAKNLTDSLLDEMISEFLQEDRRKKEASRNDEDAIKETASDKNGPSDEQLISKTSMYELPTTEIDKKQRHDPEEGINARATDVKAVTVEDNVSSIKLSQVISSKNPAEEVNANNDSTSLKASDAYVKTVKVEGDDSRIKLRQGMGANNTQDEVIANINQMNLKTNTDQDSVKTVKETMINKIIEETKNNQKESEAGRQGGLNFQDQQEEGRQVNTDELFIISRVSNDTNGNLQSPDAEVKKINEGRMKSETNKKRRKRNQSLEIVTKKEDMGLKVIGSKTNGTINRLDKDYDQAILENYSKDGGRDDLSSKGSVSNINKQILRMSNENKSQLIRDSVSDNQSNRTKRDQGSDERLLDEIKPAEIKSEKDDSLLEGSQKNARSKYVKESMSMPVDDAIGKNDQAIKTDDELVRATSEASDRSAWRQRGKQNNIIEVGKEDGIQTKNSVKISKEIKEVDIKKEQKDLSPRESSNVKSGNIEKINPVSSDNNGVKNSEFKEEEDKGILQETTEQVSSLSFEILPDSREDNSEKSEDSKNNIKDEVDKIDLDAYWPEMKDKVEQSFENKCKQYEKIMPESNKFMREVVNLKNEWVRIKTNIAIKKAEAQTELKKIKNGHKSEIDNNINEWKKKASTLRVGFVTEARKTLEKMTGIYIQLINILKNEINKNSWNKYNNKQIINDLNKDMQNNRNNYIINMQRIRENGEKIVIRGGAYEIGLEEIETTMAEFLTRDQLLGNRYCEIARKRITVIEKKGIRKVAILRGTAEFKDSVENVGDKSDMDKLDIFKKSIEFFCRQEAIKENYFEGVEEEVETLMNVFKKIKTGLPTKDWHKNTAENMFDKLTNNAGQIMEVRNFEDKGNNVYIVTYVTENNEEEMRERAAVKMVQDIYNKKRQQDIEDKEKMLFALMHIKNGKELSLNGINQLSGEERIKKQVQEEAVRMYEEGRGEKGMTNNKVFKEEITKIKQKLSTKESIVIIGEVEEKEETIKEMKNKLYYEMIKSYIKSGTTGLDKRPDNEIKDWVNSYSKNVKEMIKHQEKTIRNYEIAVKEMEEERQHNRK